MPLASIVFTKAIQKISALKGYITLGAERSGTTWLKSLTNATGVMGNAEEWLHKFNLEKPIKEYTPEMHFDFLQRCHTKNGLLIILLRRKDMLAQAISLARAHQSKRYSSPATPIAPEVYDFRKICRLYFYFSRSYQYWKTYLNAIGFSYHELVYEDLVQDPSAYVDTIRTHLDVEVAACL